MTIEHLCDNTGIIESGNLAFLQPEAGLSRVPPGQEGGRNEDVGKDPIYEGCSSSKGCYGSPVECVTDGNCNHMVTWRKKGNRFLFEVQAKTDGYVAMGLSMDTSMVGLGFSCLGIYCQAHWLIFFFLMQSGRRCRCGMYGGGWSHQGIPFLEFI